MIMVDKPTRIFVIINEDSDELDFIVKYNDLIIKKIGRGKLREFS